MKFVLSASIVHLPLIFLQRLFLDNSMFILIIWCFIYADIISGSWRLGRREGVGRYNHNNGDYIVCEWVWYHSVLLFLQEIDFLPYLYLKAVDLVHISTQA